MSDINIRVILFLGVIFSSSNSHAIVFDTPTTDATNGMVNSLTPTPTIDVEPDGFSFPGYKTAAIYFYTLGGTELMSSAVLIKEENNRIYLKGLYTDAAWDTLESELITKDNKVTFASRKN